MPEIKYTSIPLNKMFIVGRGLPKYTKAYADAHKGTYPVYSSKTENDGIFAYINTYDYDGEYLTWSTDGYAGLPAYRNGKFSCTDHAGILTLNEEYRDVYLPYVRWQVDFRKLRLGYGNQRVKVNQVKNSCIDIKIPVDDFGNFDLEKQKELATIYSQIEEQRQELIRKKWELEEISVILPESNDTKWAHVSLNDVFKEIERGNSKYTKTFCRENKGDYPVYSADNEKPLGTMSKYDYDGEYLTISINGLAGKITIFKGKFSTTADRVVCIPNENIDIRYIVHVAEPILRNKNKGRKGDLGKNEFTKLTPDMIRSTLIPIPVTNDGIYDVEKQKELSAKYEQIDMIKKELSEKLTELTEIIIS